MSMNSVKHAVKQMRERTHAGVPFSFTFLTYNSTQKSTKGYKEVKRAVLRKGYKHSQSNLADILISYTDLDTGEDRQFYMPLLIKFNGICLT